MNEDDDVYSALAGLEAIVSTCHPPPQNEPDTAGFEAFWTEETKRRYREQRKWKEAKWNELFRDYYSAVPAPANYHETVAKAIPPLIRLLSHPDYPVRGHARQVLAYFDHEFAGSIPLLMKCLTDQSAEVRAFAVTALCKDAVQPPEAVPALARCLRDSEPGVRLAAARGLKRYGSRAKAAVPALLTALNDPSNRDAVAAALKTIAPEATARERME